ncbi:hypothetical protein C8R43DRAFT_1140692 [Mycena crocata]|nr:hypothetical protein C8R43DRAFT_1140692 [Mycena crocata]
MANLCRCKGPSNSFHCQAVRCRITDRMGARLKEKLDRVPSAELLKRSIRSEESYRVVSAYLQEKPGVEGEAQGIPVSPSGAFGSIPVEVTEMVVLLLSMRDRIVFGATCRVHRAIVGRATLTATTACLQPYNLSLINLRFLQTCTATIIAGPTVKRLLCHRERLPFAKGGPMTLDVYCSKRYTRQVPAFLARVTGYTVGNYSGSLGGGGGIRSATTLARVGAPSINVFVTSSPNPLDAVLHLPTTADMGVLALDRLWHPYPYITFNGVALTTPARLPVNSLFNRQKAWDVIQSNYDVGVDLDSQFRDYHTCSSAPSCPLTEHLVEGNLGGVDHRCIVALSDLVYAHRYDRPLLHYCGRSPMAKRTNVANEKIVATPLDQPRASGSYRFLLYIYTSSPVKCDLRLSSPI